MDILNSFFHRLATNTDVFQRLLVASDPFISLTKVNHSKIKKKHKPLTKEMENLLIKDIIEDDSDIDEPENENANDHLDSKSHFNFSKI